MFCCQKQSQKLTICCCSPAAEVVPWSSAPLAATPDFRRFLSNPTSPSSFRFFVAIFLQRSDNNHKTRETILNNVLFCFVFVNKLAALRMRTTHVARAKRPDMSNAKMPTASWQPCKVYVQYCRPTRLLIINTVLNWKKKDWLSPTERASVSAISIRHIFASPGLVRPWDNRGKCYIA